MTKPLMTKPLTPPRGPKSAVAQTQTTANDTNTIPALFYEFSPDFGSYFKSLRTGRGYSIRKVAAELNAPAGYIQRLEAGKWASKPSLQLLERMAALFGLPAADFEARAGVRRDVRPDMDRLVSLQFKTLLMHPNYRQSGLNEDWLESFSVKQKRWIVQLLRQSNEQTKTGGASPNEILAEAGLLTPGPA